MSKIDLPSALIL